MPPFLALLWLHARQLAWPFGEWSGVGGLDVLRNVHIGPRLNSGVHTWQERTPADRMVVVVTV